MNARVSYSTAYYDLADRTTDVVNVGTNGGSAYTRPGTVPSRSDTVLVTSYEYDSAGRLEFVTDPRGLVSQTVYDLMGRTTKSIENYVDGVVSDADDKTTVYGYGPAGMTSITSLVTGGGGQTTEYVYGVSTGTGSTITSNDIVGTTKWPDPTTGSASSSEQETLTVNALGQTLTATDRNGNVHTLTYDILGRVISDAVTTLGTGVNGAVRRIEYGYDGQGNQFLVTSYDAATGGSIVNQVKREFNGLGQVTAIWQSHSGAVTGSTPKVGYTYTEMAGGANHSRMTGMTYPSGYAVAVNYASGLDASISRLSSFSDTSGTLVDYSYLGLGTVVIEDRPQPDFALSHVLRVPEALGDAGDIYTGLDRFGRVERMRWLDGTGTALDWEAYTLDRDGNRLTATNIVNGDFSEAYGYDNLNQLTSFDRNSGDRTQAWDYDSQGNMQSVTTDSVTETRTHNAQNEVTGVGSNSLTFDSNGNMTTDETGRQFVYDAWNRLVVVKDSGGATLKTFGYDGTGWRVTETVGSTTRDLYYSAGWQVVEETVTTGSTTKLNARYVWGQGYVDDLVYRQRDTDNDGVLDERVWAIHDANWNITALVNDLGNVVERYAYDAYGVRTVMDAGWNVLGASAYGFVHGFQGLRFDEVAGLSDARNRWYSPTLGRFVTNDPIGYSAGDVNLYRFVGNSPGVGVDPSGLEGELSIRETFAYPTQKNNKSWGNFFVGYEFSVKGQGDKTGVILQRVRSTATIQGGNNISTLIPAAYKSKKTGAIVSELVEFNGGDYWELWIVDKDGNVHPQTDNSTGWSFFRPLVVKVGIFPELAKATQDTFPRPTHDIIAFIKEDLKNITGGELRIRGEAFYIPSCNQDDFKKLGFTLPNLTGEPNGTGAGGRLYGSTHANLVQSGNLAWLLALKYGQSSVVHTVTSVWNGAGETELSRSIIK